MPWITLAAAAVLKVSPCPVAALVFCSIVRWRGPKYAVHLFHVCSAECFLSHYERSFGKEFSARSDFITKEARRLLEKGRPTHSAFFCASSMALMYSGMRGLFIQKDGSRRRIKMTSASLRPPPLSARSLSTTRGVTLQYNVLCFMRLRVHVSSMTWSMNLWALLSVARMMLWLVRLTDHLCSSVQCVLSKTVMFVL